MTPSNSCNIRNFGCVKHALCECQQLHWKCPKRDYEIRLKLQFSLIRKTISLKTVIDILFEAVFAKDLERTYTEASLLKNLIGEWYKTHSNDSVMPLFIQNDKQRDTCWPILIGLTFLFEIHDIFQPILLVYRPQLSCLHFPLQYIRWLYNIRINLTVGQVMHFQMQFLFVELAWN